MGFVAVDDCCDCGPGMTQLLLPFPTPAQIYDRAYYHANKARRRAQRLASKWGGHFRCYLRGCL